jgi:AraC family transcriptional regulator of adaptative response/methylated-DNA-[protein]-cysteine methyltransferase
VITIHISELTKTNFDSAKMEIEWGISASPFGKMLIAQTERGIVQLSLFESEETESYDQLTRDWPQAKLKRDDGFASKISSQISKPYPTPTLSLHLRGTAFQLKVWKALLEIPAGKTRSYSQLAASIGNPRSARAVGNAVGKNRIACLIPCHRVVCEGGSLGGYRWGRSRKSKLLAWEKSLMTRP